MKGRLILSASINRKSKFIELTRPFMETYAKKTNADLIIIEDSNPLLKILNTTSYQIGRANNQAYVLKIKLVFYYLEHYENVLWLDDTSIVRAHTCDLFDYIDNNYIVAFNEGVIPTIRSSKYDKKFIKDNMNFLINELNYINSGVVVYNHNIRKYLSDEYIDKYKVLFKSVYPHQAYMNYVIQFYKLPCYFIDRTFNEMFIVPNVTRNIITKNISKESICDSKTMIYHITGYYDNRYNIIKHICNLISSNV
jgi:hypothetical protein